MIDVSNLDGVSFSDRIAEYAANLPDGKAVALADVASELGCSIQRVKEVSLQKGLLITAFDSSSDSPRKKGFLANSKTVQTWMARQKK